MKSKPCQDNNILIGFHEIIVSRCECIVYGKSGKKREEEEEKEEEKEEGLCRVQKIVLSNVRHYHTFTLIRD